MTTLLILWAIALAACDKLDRTYLPPPGSISASGHPGDLNLPLEYPQENYPSTLEPGRGTIIDNGSLGANYPNIAFGIDRKGPVVESFKESFNNEPGPPFSNNVYSVPITTTSYAFTQTTTLSPIERFETPAGPIGIVSQGYSSTLSPFNPAPGLSYEQYITQRLVNPQNLQLTGLVEDPNLSDALLPSENIGQLPQKLPSGASNLITGSVQSKGVDSPFSNSDKSVSTNLTHSYPDGFYDNQSSLPSETVKGPQFLRGNLQYTIPQSSDTSDGINVYPQYSSDSSNKYSSDPSNTGASPTLVSSQTSVGTPIPRTFTPSFESSSSPLFVPSNAQPERIRSEADRNAIILSYENILTPEGFAYSFDTSNGIHADESGTAINGVKAQGSYSYTGDDGKVYSVVYTADENGFLPHGDHLPTAPPIPDAILKVIEQAEMNKQLGIFDDGSYNDAKYGHDRYQGKSGHMKQEPLTDVHGNYTPVKTSAVSSVRSSPERHDTSVNSGKRTDNEDDTKQKYLNPSKINTGYRNKLLSEGNIPNKNTFLDSDKMENVNENIKFTNVPINKPSESSEIIDRLPGTFHTEFTTTLNSKMDIDQPLHTGYEYSHPQKKFNDNEGNKLQSRFSNDNSEDGETHTEKVLRKPFITPNVSFNPKTDDTSLPSRTSVNNYKFRNQNDNADINHNETPSFYDKGSSQINDEDVAVTDRVFNPRVPEYKSTDSKFYEAPLTSIIANEREKINYPTSTSPLPSDISSRLTSSTNGVDYSQTPPTTSGVSSTFRPSGIAEIPSAGIISRQPSYTGTTSKLESVDDRISTPRPSDYGFNGMPGYRGRPRIPIVRAEFSEGGLKPRFGVPAPRLQTSPQASRVSGPINSVGQKNRENMLTEKVNGEDFSGPKQLERFDPDHGYYY